MGVNHLKRDAAAVSSGKMSGNIHGSPHTKQVQSGDQFARPAQNSGTTSVPRVGSVDSFSDKAKHPGTSAAQPPKGADNGGRAGSKSSQEKTGASQGYKKPMTGGQMG